MRWRPSTFWPRIPSHSAFWASAFHHLPWWPGPETPFLFICQWALLSSLHYCCDAGCTSAEWMPKSCPLYFVSSWSLSLHNLVIFFSDKQVSFIVDHHFASLPNIRSITLFPAYLYLDSCEILLPAATLANKFSSHYSAPHISYSKAFGVNLVAVNTM